MRTPMHVATTKKALKMGGSSIRQKCDCFITSAEMDKCLTPEVSRDSIFLS